MNESKPTPGTAATDVEIVDVSIVIPVYRGTDTLPALIEEVAPLCAMQMTPDGHSFRVMEVILVWDRGPDDSDLTIAALAEKHAWVRPLWLSRNFGQHPATVAGMAASRGTWVVTMDEDGQHDPTDIALLIDQAYRDDALLVYAAPTNKPPHSRLRNAASALTKGLVLRALLGSATIPFHSFRLVNGEHARAVAAYCGSGVYLDVALGWFVDSVTSCPVRMRTEGRDSTSYNLRRLTSHFWRLVISAGNRPLRIVSGLGLVTAAIGIISSIVLVAQRITGSTDVQGWTSSIVVTLIIGGLVLVSLGVIAEYLGMAANLSMGRPLFVVTSAPRRTTRRLEDTSVDV